MFPEHLSQRNLEITERFFLVIGRYFEHHFYLKHRDERVVAAAAQQLAVWLQPQFQGDLLGPDRPHVGYVQLLHIRKILLKVDASRSATEVRQLLRAYQKGITDLPQFRSVTIYFDVDPV